MAQKPDRSRITFCSHHRQEGSLSADGKPRIDFEKTCSADLFCKGVPRKKPSRKTWIFSFVPQGTTSFAWHTPHHLSVSSTSLPPRAAQMNDVAPLVQMKLPSANKVMLTPNDVALRANGIRLVVLYVEIKLIFSWKCVIMKSRKAVLICK